MNDVRYVSSTTEGRNCGSAVRRIERAAWTDSMGVATTIEVVSVSSDGCCSIPAAERTAYGDCDSRNWHRLLQNASDDIELLNSMSSIMRRKLRATSIVLTPG